MQLFFSRKVSYPAIFLVGALLITACAPVAPPSSPPAIQTVIQTSAVSQISSGAQSGQSADTKAYETVMSVVTSQRCMNCHPTGDRPRQRDEQIFHILNVTRGEDNLGGPVQSCETCHHEENNPYSLVPGAPHWGLAPKSMGWFGLSDAEIAATLLDPTKNGERTYEDLLDHMSNDALVLWAWDPGEGRTPPPVSHAEFVQALETWLDAGAPIPAE